MPGVSPRFIAIVAWMLGVRPTDRPQSVAELRAVLNGQAPVPTPAPPTSISNLPPASGFDAAGADDTVLRPSAPAVTSFPATQLAAAFQPTMVLGRNGAAPADHGLAGSASTAPAPRRNMMFAGLAAGLLVAAVVLWQFIGLLGGSRSNGAAGLAAASAALPASGASDGLRASGLDVSAASAVASRATAAAPGLAPSAAELPIEAQASQVPAVPPAPAMATRAPPLNPALAVLAGGVAAGPAASAATAASGPASRPRPTARAVNLRTAEGMSATTRPAVPPPAPDDAPARSSDGGGARESTSGPAPSGPLSAREACGNRVFIALAICMDRECERPQFRDNPECVRVLNVKRQRAER